MSANVTPFGRMLFLYILIAHLFEVHVHSSECLPEVCLSIAGANVSGTMPDNCTRVFSVSINSTGSEVEEAERVTLTCVHDLPKEINVTYEWKKDSELTTVGREREYTIEKTFSEHKGSYYCEVRSKCGNYMSAPHDVTIHNNSVIILVICGCSALAIIVLMGVSMKIKMHRDKIKNQQRTKERLQEMRRAQDLPNHVPRQNPTAR